jgi:DNA-binding transcriptional MerR regulator
MTLILRGRRFGFSLEEIRQWLELYDADPEGKTQRDAWLAHRGPATFRAALTRRVELDEIIDRTEGAARRHRGRRALAPYERRTGFLQFFAK